MQNEGLTKGFIIKLFGVVLVFLGALDSMLTWRGGLAPSDFHFWLIAAGLLLYGIGAVRRGASDPRSERGE
jgi:hypothetical protein